MEGQLQGSTDLLSKQTLEHCVEEFIRTDTLAIRVYFFLASTAFLGLIAWVVVSIEQALFNQLITVISTAFGSVISVPPPVALFLSKQESRRNFQWQLNELRSTLEQDRRWPEIAALATKGVKVRLEKGAGT